jgi:hypothetical protein
MTEDELQPTTRTLKAIKEVKTKTKGGVIKVETMSLDQFRSYLKGIMFVGGPTWRPDREQWEAIVAIIDKLTTTGNTQPTAAVAHQAPQNNWQQSPTWEPMPQQPQRPSPSAMDTVSEDGGTYTPPFI